MSHARLLTCYRPLSPCGRHLWRPPVAKLELAPPLSHWARKPKPRGSLRRGDKRDDGGSATQSNGLPRRLPPPALPRRRSSGGGSSSARRSPRASSVRRVPGEERAAAVEAWKKLFEKFDIDRTGELSLNELREVVRGELLLSDEALPEVQLQELWKHVDVSGDGSISSDEFASFVLAPNGHDDPEDAAVCLKMNEQMRLLELVDQVAAKLNASLATRSRAREGFGAGRGHVSWFSLFSSVDSDGTGALDAHELERVLRDELGLDHSQLSDNEYRWLWQFIDTGADGLVGVGEFAEFMTGRGDEQKRRQRRRKKAAAAAQKARKSTESSITAKTEERAATDDDPAGQAFSRLFDRYDSDGTGLLDFDEFLTVIRSELLLRETELPQTQLEALWGRIDSSGDGLATHAELSFTVNDTTEPRVGDDEAAVIAGVCAKFRQQLQKLALADRVCRKMTEQLRAITVQRRGFDGGGGDTTAGGGHMSWYKLFNKYDRDKSGMIDTVEMERAIRTDLGMSASVLSDLEYAWCVSFTPQFLVYLSARRLGPNGCTG